MERCSYFIENRALFGSFPTQQDVNFLEQLGVRYFVDLTKPDESKTTPYKTNYVYINYPIIDRKIPEDWRSFANLVVKVCIIIRNLKQDEKVYIHCKGGHGRSGILVACIFCQYYGMSTEEALKQTARCHARRPEMREKWRKLGSPQGMRQKDFVHRFFRPLRFTKPEVAGYTIGMHNLSPYTVEIPNVGIFPNAQVAFQYFRAPNNKEYVENLLKGKYCQEYLPEHNRDWEENKINYMYRVLEYKFKQHGILKKNLVSTGLRPLVKVSHDSFWGDGGNGQGKNIHGKLLNKLRVKFLTEEII